MRSIHFTAMTVLLLTGVAVAFQADRAAKQQFEERFGPQFRKVMASRATDDDAAMAADLLTAAKLTNDNPALAVELCENAFVLAARDPSTLDLAIESMMLVGATMPDKAAASRDKVVAFLRRNLLTAKGEERMPYASRLILVLVKQGDELSAASDFGGAARAYAQAWKIVEDEKIPKMEALKAKFDAAAAREKLEIRIEQANVKLATDPTNATAAAELFQIYFIELDNPVQAMRYVERGGTAAAKKLLPLATGDVRSLTAAQMMEIAEWLESVSLEAPAMTRSALIKRSRSFYEMYVLMPDADKLQLVKASLAIKRLREAWARANPEEAKSLAPVDDSGWADMLAGVDPLRYRSGGRWRRGEKGFTITAESDPVRLMLPGVVPGSYEFTAKFTRSGGDGAVVFILPVRDQQVRLVLSGWNGKASGLYSLASETIDPQTGVIRNTSTVMPGMLENDREYTLAVRAVLRGNDVSFAVDLDGERLIDWSGGKADLKLDAAWTLRETGAFGLGAQQATVQFGEAKLRSLEGDITLLPKPATLAERGVVMPADGFVDLTEIWDPAKDAIEGHWLREIDALIVDRLRKGERSRTRMPVLPDGNYTLRTRFTCIDNRRSMGGPIVYLPLKTGQVAVVMGAGQRGNLAGLSNIAGKDATNNDTTTTTDVLEVGKRHLLESRVSHIGENVRIECDLDGKKLIRWEGPATSLALTADSLLGDGRSPGIGMYWAEVSYDTVEMRMDSGSAPLVRQPPKLVVTDTTPVDLLKLVDPRKHAYAGPWTMEGGKLSTMTATSSTIMLPIVPQGNYEFRTKFMRSGGRPTIQLYLPIPGGSFDVTLGANDGRTCSISATPVKGDPPTNIVSNSNVRMVNSTLYTVRVKVESKGGRGHIWVELDGKPYLEWQGSLDYLRPVVTLPDGFNSRAPGIIVSNLVARSGATFTDLEVKMLTGSSRKLE